LVGKNSGGTLVKTEARRWYAEMVGGGAGSVGALRKRVGRAQGLAELLYEMASRAGRKARQGGGCEGEDGMLWKAMAVGDRLLFEELWECGDAVLERRGRLGGDARVWFRGVGGEAVLRRLLACSGHLRAYEVEMAGGVEGGPTKFEACCDGAVCFDELRANAVWAAVVACGGPAAALGGRLEAMCQVVPPDDMRGSLLECVAAETRAKAARLKCRQWVEGGGAWAAYLKVVKRAAYYLSDVEVALAAECAGLGVRIFKEPEKGCAAEAEGWLEELECVLGREPALIVLRGRTSAQRERSHFELLRVGEEDVEAMDVVLCEEESVWEVDGWFGGLSEP